MATEILNFNYCGVVGWTDSRNTCCPIEICVTIGFGMQTRDPFCFSFNAAREPVSASVWTTGIMLDGTASRDVTDSRKKQTGSSNFWIALDGDLAALIGLSFSRFSIPYKLWRTRVWQARASMPNDKKRGMFGFGVPRPFVFWRISRGTCGTVWIRDPNPQ